MDRFLYDNGLRHERVKLQNVFVDKWETFAHVKMDSNVNGYSLFLKS